MLSGACQCGALRYQVEGDPVGLYVCHCRECQKQSASAFGISVIVPAKAFRVTQGTVREWSRRTDTGRMLACMFCAECGTRICHVSPGAPTLSVKGGSLASPVDLTGAVHIWTARALRGVVIPKDAVQFPGEPD